MAKEDEIKGETLKEKAVKLIRDTYSKAAERRSENNWEVEKDCVYYAEGMGEMAKLLGVLTEDEVKSINLEYWLKRKNIPQDFPDRF